MHIETDINLLSLAAKLIDNIKEHWQNPFASPVVIFSDSKLEQWFKCYWMKNAKEILMNLDMVRLDSFLMECVGYEGAVLKDDVLRDSLILKLIEKDSKGAYYYKSLSPEVDRYLTNGDSLNENHLFDFASQMVTLFREYEITRPGEIEYKGGKVNFGNGLDCKWQEKLYNDVIGTNGISVGDINYKTLFQAYRDKKSKAVLPDKYKGRPVYLFGFSGIGELHREVLQQVSDNITVFLQTANIENEPFKTWSVAGYDHYRKYTENDLEKIKVDVGDKDKSVDYSKCPSKLRETEILYSSICRLVQGGAAPQDILVVAPSVGEYSEAISQVFDYNKGEGEKVKAGERIPLRMSYVRTDCSSATSYVAQVVDTLIGILYSDGLSRDSIFRLLRNPMVQYVRDIDNDEVTNWLSWVENMNIYRDRGSVKDWENAKCRLLIARLTSETVEAGNDVYKPYETLDTQNNASLCRFISVIDDLYELIDSKGPVVDKDKLGILDKCFTGFAHKSGNLPDELAVEGAVYAVVKGYINHLYRLFATGKSMPLRVVCCGLRACSNGSSLNVGKVFLDGVTFSNIIPNRVMTAKHLFMIGMDSKAFPRQQKNDSLDCRVKTDADHTITQRDLDTFLCLLNAAETVSVSYVDRDLKKDDTFYPAVPVQQLMSMINKEAAEISIDENGKRNVEELFTMRELRNRENYERMLNNNRQSSKINTPETNTLETKPEFPDRVSVYQIRQYLEDPLVAYANRFFGGDEEEVEAEDTYFEPLELDNLKKAVLRKEYVKKQLSGERVDMVKTLLTERCFVDESLAQKAADVITEEGDVIKKSIEDFNLGDLQLDENAFLSLRYGNDTLWQITGALSWYRLEDGKLYVVEISRTQNLLSSYVTALVVIAQTGEDGIVYEVELYSSTELQKTMKLEKSRAIELQKTMKLEKSQAIEVLNEIYKRMFVDKYHKCVRIESVIDGTESDDYESLNAFYKKLTQEHEHGFWQYFKHKDMFDKCDLGYDEVNFGQDYDEEVAKHKKLILYDEPTTEE